MIDYACCTEAGRRPVNEDNCHIPESGGLSFVIVADGMGGHKAGQIASTMAVSEILQKLGEEHPTEDRLCAAVEHANLAVYRHSHEDYSCRGMGTTVVFASLSDTGYIAGNIGDSRIYQFSTKNGLVQISRDHSLVSILVATGEITKEQAKKHPQRNIITRALGTRDEEALDIFHGAWEVGDILLLCSDGLHGSLEDEEIIAILSEKKPLQERCDALCALAYENGSTDNITAVLAENRGGACS